MSVGHIACLVAALSAGQFDALEIGNGWAIDDAT